MSAATRGNAAINISSGLNCKIVISLPGGMTQATGKTLLEVKRETEGKLIGKLASVRNNFFVSYSELSKDHIIDLSPYLYQTVDAYFNGTKAIYVSKSNSIVYTGKITQSTNGSIVLKDAAKEEHTLKTKDGADKVPVCINGGERLVEVGSLAVRLKDLTVSVVANPDGTLAGIIAEKADAVLQVYYTYISGKASFCGFDLPTDGDGKADLSKVTVTGDATSLEDVKTKDIVTVYPTEDGSKIKFAVSRNTVEGKCTKQDGEKFYINGEAYEKLPGVSFALGLKYVFYLDIDGRIAAAELAEPIYVPPAPIYHEGYFFLSEYTCTEVAGVTAIKLVNSSGETLSLTPATGTVISIGGDEIDLTSWINNYFEHPDLNKLIVTGYYTLNDKVTKICVEQLEFCADHNAQTFPAADEHAVHFNVVFVSSDTRYAVTVMPGAPTGSGFNYLLKGDKCVVTVIY